ncbi:hypothetical protein SGPA1_30925 [Streptomyces misionensis JCM 4497]
MAPGDADQISSPDNRPQSPRLLVAAGWARPVRYVAQAANRRSSGVRAVVPGPDGGTAVIRR